MILRRSAFDSVGGFDERFLLYFEDMDLCVRLRHQNWTVLLDPDVVVSHRHRAASRKSLFGWSARQHMRSALLFYREHPSSLLPSGPIDQPHQLGLDQEQTPEDTYGSDLIAIAVVTRRRQESLQRLLETLVSDYGSQPNISLVVVDNDPQGSSRDVVERVCAAFCGPVIYRIEAREGYASVRNAAVAAAAGVDYLAFIDDDEVPEQGWLHHLLDARRHFAADIVAGPVVADFSPDTPSWLRTSALMSAEQPKLQTGSRMPWCATSNVLVAYRVFDRIPGWFDLRFNATGGEDTHLFLRARVAGFGIVWTNEAQVREAIPLSRTRSSWILRRAARTGNNKALIETEVLGGLKVILIRFAKSVILVGIGIAIAVAGALRRNRAMALRGLQRSAEGAGALAGLIGIRTT
jgi:succinoglycan biosynthesis protein ExoM